MRSISPWSLTMRKRAVREVTSRGVKGVAPNVAAVKSTRALACGAAGCVQMLSARRAILVDKGVEGGGKVGHGSTASTPVVLATPGERGIELDAGVPFHAQVAGGEQRTSRNRPGRGPWLWASTDSSARAPGSVQPVR